jgi:hypothetical protein
MQAITRRLLEGGGEAIRALVAEKHEETLYLEFKALQSALNPEGKRRAMKAICGLSNSVGGTLVIGIQTAKSDDIDIADEAKPVSDASSFANRLKAAIAEGLSPQHPGIEVYPVLDGGGPAGFVVVDVPRSELRPHMSLAKDEYRYYRRGLVGTTPMHHGEIRDMMLAPREASLSLTFQVSIHSRSAGSFGGKLSIDITNNSRAPAFAPYVILSPDRISPAHIWHHATQPQGSLFYSGRDFIVHPNTSVSLGTADLWFGLHLIVMRGSTESVVDKILGRREDDLLTISSSRDGVEKRDNRIPEYDFQVGAENMQPLSVTYRTNKWEILREARAGIIRMSRI